MSILYVGVDPATLDPERQLVALWRRQAVRDLNCPVCGAEGVLDRPLEPGELSTATFLHEAHCPVGGS